MTDGRHTGAVPDKGSQSYFCDVHYRVGVQVRLQGSIFSGLSPPYLHTSSNQKPKVEWPGNEAMNSGSTQNKLDCDG